jgi:hypothetical protein
LRITACITQGLESNDLAAFAVKITYTMALKPIDTLKKGLAKFSKQIKACKDELNAKLLRRETISLADEEWLDHEANTVDEQHVLDELEAASDYERGFERLSEDKKATVTKLKEWAEELVKVPGNKWKRMMVFMP